MAFFCDYFTKLNCYVVRSPALFPRRSDPGQIMVAYALLQRNPDPTSDDIRYALKDTLCRCAGYPSIQAAIQAAVHSLKTGEPIPLPEVPESITVHKIVGHKQVRPDAVSKVTGKAIFTDDLVFDGMLFASVRRAGIPHGILRRLDVQKASSLPGVRAVLTAQDLP